MSDPIDWTAAASKALDDGQAQQIRNNLANSLDANPQQEAGYRQLYDSTGIPIPAIRENEPAVRTQDTMQKFDANGLIQNAPVTANLLSDPDNAKLLHKSIPALSATEQAVNAFGDAANWVLSAPGTSHNLGTDVVTPVLQTLGGSFNRLAHSAWELGSALPGAAGDYSKQNADLLDYNYNNFLTLGKDANFTQKAAGVAGSTLGVMSQAILSSPVRAADAALMGWDAVKDGVLHGIRSMAVPAASSATNTYSEVLAKTGNLSDAAAAAQMEYITSTMGGVVPFATPGSLLWRGAAGAATGIVTGDVTHNLMNLALPDSMQAAPLTAEDRALSAFSGVVFGALAGPHDVNDINGRMYDQARQSYIDAAHAEQITKAGQALGVIGQLSSGGGVRDLNQGLFHQFVQDVATNSPVDNLWIDGEKFAQVMHDNGVTLNDINQVMPDLAAQLQEPGGMLKIPLADYATHIAGTEFDQPLRDNMRLEPDGQTFGEAQTFFQDQKNQLGEMAAKIVGEKSKDDAWRQSSDHVYNETLSQLTDANRFPDAVNKLYAAQQAAFIETTAHSEGMLPHELMDKLKLEINADSLPGGDNVMEQDKTPEQIGQNFTEQVRTDPTMVDQYIAANGKVVDPDKAKALSPEFEADPSLARFVHEGSSELAQKVYEKLLAENPKGQPVVFTAGGGGSGKTETMPMAKAATGISGDGIVVDGTLSKFDKAKSRIDQALDAGAPVDIVYTNRHVNDAFKFAMGRDRVVPLSELSEAHVGASDTIRQLDEHYKDDPRVHIEVVNNLGTKDDLHIGKLDDLPKYDHNQVLGELHGIAREARDNGTITDKRYSDLIPPDDAREPASGDRQVQEGHGGQELGRPGPGERGEGSVLDQPARGQIAFGEDISKQPSVITLFKDADLSTFLHEQGHFFLEAMSHMAGKENASGRIKNDMQTILDQFGVKDLGEWNGMGIEDKRPFHEQFARSYESYLMEGRAPTTELQSSFNRFSSWLVQIYKKATALGVEVSPDLKGVFDRMVASQDAIERTEAIRGMQAMFAEKPEGMTDQEFADYQQMGKDATADAVADLRSRALRDMKWASNAKAGIIKELQRKAASIRKGIRDEVGKEVGQQPIYQAETWIKRGEMTTEDGEQIKAEKGHRLNAEDVKRMYPDQNALNRPDLTKLKGMTGPEGLHPDIVADMFGFGSGDELVRSLIDMPARSEVIDGMTDQRMLQEHGELTDPVSIERAAEEAIHNDVRARFISSELKALAKAVGPVRMMFEAAKEAAYNVISGQKVGDIYPKQYQAAEGRASRDSMEALKKGDTAGAANKKREQLLNNQLAKQASDALKEVDKALAYQRKFDRASIRDKLDGEFLQQIDRLRSMVDFRKNPTEGPNRAQQSLEKWAEGLRNLGYEPQIADWLNDLSTPRSYQDLSMTEFRGVIDAIKSMEFIAREQRKITIDGKKLDLKETVDTLNARMDERGEKFTKEDLLVPPTVKTDGVWKSVTHWMGVKMRLIHADLLPAEYKFNKYDLHELDGPFRKFILDPLLKANYRKSDLTKMVSDAAAKIGKELGPEWQKSLYDMVPNRYLEDPDLGGMMKITRSKMLGIARHVGNESNFDKMTKGWGWDGAAVWKFLHENMTEKDWQATQAHWDSFDPLWKETEGLIERLGGVPPPKIPAREFRTQFGVMKGGYSPIDYDPLRSKLNVKMGQFDLTPGDELGGTVAYKATTTSNGSLNNRVEGYSDRVNLDVHSAEARIRDTIHDLAYREALINATKVMDDRAFREKFMATYGSEEFQALQTFLKNIRDTNVQDPRTRNFDKAMQYTRQGVVLTGIGYRLSTVLKHGGAAAMKTLGYLGTGQGAGYFAARLARMASGHMMEDIASAREKFSEIRTRMLQMDRDYKQGNSSMYEAESWQAKNDRFGHAMVAWSDALSAVPTAWAAYDLATTSGVPESMGGTGKPMSESEAVSYANSVVRQAHGSALEITRSNFMQARGAKGLFGALYGFMNNTYGQFSDMLDKSISGGYFKNNPAVAGRLLATLIVPALWTQWLTKGGPDDKEPWYEWGTKAIAGEVGAMVPFVRDGVTFLEWGHTSPTAPIQALTDVLKSGQDIWEESQGKQTKLIQDLCNSMGEWAHIAGLGQLGHILQYMRETAEGKHHPDTKAQEVKEAVVGGAKHK